MVEVEVHPEQELPPGWSWGAHWKREGDDTLPVSDRVDCLLRDADLFQDWLDSWGSGAVVGYSRSDETCPLARFLREFVGEEVCVSVQGVYLGKLVTYLPLWARYFVAVVDRTAPGMPPVPITADEARRFLNLALERMPRRIYPAADVAAEVALEVVR